jgi:tRNA (cmo5U34)-methyltransferase
MAAEVWQQREVAAAFLNERSVLIPDRARQLEVMLRELYQEIFDLLAEGGTFVNAEHVASATPAIEKMFDDAMAEHLCQRRQERGEAVTKEQVHREFLERPDRSANILAPVEEQCRWLRGIGFRDVDCFWRLFELAIFGGRR